VKKTKGFPFTAGIVLAMAFAFLCPAAFADDALAYHNKGREAFEKKEYDQAISDFTQAIRLNPNFFKAYTNRGLAYQQKGDYDKAISDFTQAIRLNPNFGTAYGSRGFAYALKGQYYREMEDWESALRHYNNAADDLYSALRIDPSLEAAPAIKKLLEEVESSIVILKWKAQSKGGNVQEKTAPPPVQQTAPPPTSPKDAAEAAYKRGRAADNNKNYDLAVKEFTEAIRLVPNGSDDYYFHRAKVYILYLKNYDAAIADVNNALRLKADPESYFLRGVAYHAKGDYAKAVADFEKSLQLDPDNNEVKEALAFARQQARPAPPPVQEARPVAPPPPPMSPKDAAKAARAAFERGEAAGKNGDYDKAIEEYTEAIRLDRLDHNSNRYLSKQALNGRAYKYWVEKKDNDNAILDYTELIRLDPDNSDHYFNRGLMYRSKDNNKAIIDLTEAIRLVENIGSKGVYYSVRGDCYMNIGNYAQAIADYEESLRLKPKSSRDVKASIKEAKRLMKR
jgi:tetratricopeptide (TPR) repeat protein